MWARVHLEDPHCAVCGLQQLHQQIMDHHGEKCVVAAQAADAVSSNAAEGGVSTLAGAASNVMDLMMRLRNVKASAVTANKVALEAEQAKDALERDVQALERAMKRPQTEASSTKNAEGMKVDEDMWDLGQHQWVATFACCALHARVAVPASQHENKPLAGGGHVPRRQSDLAPCFTTRCLAVQGHPVLLLLPFSWHAHPLCCATIQLLV